MYIDDGGFTARVLKQLPVSRRAVDRSRAVVARRAAEVIIKRTTAGDAHLDGEPLTLPRELQVRVRPRSLNVLVPAANAESI